MTKRGILIVGGGILQIPALQRARELGLTTHLTDGSAACAARNHADVFHHVDTSDVEGTSALASKLAKAGEIEAVYTQGTDVEYTVAMAARAAGLPGIEPEAALTCKNKIRMRERLHAAGIDATRFAVVREEKDLPAAVAAVGLPAFMKPADNCASRGVTRVSRADDAPQAYRTAREATVFTDDILLEAELAGPEYSVDTVVVDGKVIPAGVSDRGFLEKHEFAVQTSSTTPSMLSESVQAAMYDLMQRAATALGITFGAFKGDLVLTDGEPRIIELAARTSGGFDSQYRKPYSFGIDIIKATMDLARGLPFDPRDLTPKWVKWSRTFSVLPTPGRVTSVVGMEETLAIPGVRQIFMHARPGGTIPPYDNCAVRPSHIVISADSVDQLDQLERRVKQTLRIVTEPIQ